MTRLPGMGVVLTAEFHAEVSNLGRFPSGDHLAAASGLAPAIQQSGKVRYLRRATGGNRRLKRIFYQAAFCALTSDPASKAFYARKRKEGKTHQQAVIALARRRINVLHSMLHSHRAYDPSYAAAE
ncbi:transposase [Actinopolymorpha pittospori]